MRASSDATTRHSILFATRCRLEKDVCDTTGAAGDFEGHRLLAKCWLEPGANGGVLDDPLTTAQLGNAGARTGQHHASEGAGLSRIRRLP